MNSDYLEIKHRKARSLFIRIKRGLSLLLQIPETFLQSVAPSLHPSVLKNQEAEAPLRQDICPCNTAYEVHFLVL